MKRFPLWLKLSFLHPAGSVLLLSVAYLAPEPPAWGAVGYFTGMFGFLLNLPGIGAINAVLPPAAIRQVPDVTIVSGMILITWGCMVVPVCFGLSRLVRWRRRARSQSAAAGRS